VRPLRLLTCALLGALLSAAPARAAVQEEIIVKRAPGLSAAERADVRADAGVELEAALRLPRTELVRADPGERAEALAALNADPDVLWAEPNLERRVFTTDPYFDDLWGLHNTGQVVESWPGTADADVDAPEAWVTSRGDGVDVAVVDTGVQLNHQDLSVLAGYDFVDGDATASDGHGHGTHVAGTIAALENTTAVVGVAPGAEILPVRVLDDSGRGSVDDVADGFDLAGDRNVRVVNASLGSDTYSAYERAAIAAHPNTLYVVAAGNDGADNDATPAYPCNYDEPNIVCVGASDSDDLEASFSNYGDVSVDLFAPGLDIRSLPLTPADEWKSGTSMASPHVAGAAALLAASAPGAGPAQLKRALLDGAEAKPAFAGRSVAGARLNAAQALAELGGLDVAAPAAPAGVVASGGDRAVTLGWAPNGENDLAGYRVRSVPDTAGVSTTTSSPLRLGGLTAGRTYTYAVSAVDTAGNESPRTTVSATTDPPPPVVAPPLAPVAPLPAPAAPPPTGTAAPATVTGARLSGRVALCRAPCRDRRGRLAFTLGAAARVTVKLERRTCRGSRCTWKTAGRRTLPLAGGRRSLIVGSKLAGITLRPGSWRVTLATAQHRTAVPFRVYAR